MIRFSNAQMGGWDDLFTKRLCEHLIGAQTRARGLPDGALRDVVRDARRRALDAGFSTEQHHCDLAEAAVCHGSGLWVDPKYLDIVNRRFWTKEEKARAIRGTFVQSAQESNGDAVE